MNQNQIENNNNTIGYDNSQNSIFPMNNNNMQLNNNQNNFNNGSINLQNGLGNIGNNNSVLEGNNQVLFENNTINSVGNTSVGLANVDNNLSNNQDNDVQYSGGQINNLDVVNNENSDSKKNSKKKKKEKKEKTKEEKIKTEFGKNTETAKTVKMIRFQYKVKDQDGKIIDSYFDAESQMDVQSFLLNKGYEVISIKEDKLSTKLGLASISISKKMNSKDLNFFLTQLSTYVKSGIPLVDSMEILSRQSKNKSVQMLYRKIVFELNKGTPFSVCLEKQGNVFPKMLVNMIKTSEMTGDLTGVLDDMAAYYKQQDSNRKQIISAMTYPSVLMIFALCVLTFVITYVVPSFTSMYSSVGSTLPTITIIIMNISDFVIANWYIILAVVVVVAIIIRLLYKSSKKVKYLLQSFVMHIPVVSDIIKYNQLVTFTGTFATLIKHDVFITDSMDILSKITDNEIYKKIIDDSITNLSKGNGVSVAFKGHWAFPATAYEMLVTGERTGKLGEMMQHVTEYYQEEQTNLISRLKSLIEPLMIVVLAILVGVILLAVVVPMFDIYSKII